MSESPNIRDTFARRERLSASRFRKNARHQLPADIPTTHDRNTSAHHRPKSVNKPLKSVCLVIRQLIDRDGIYKCVEKIEEAGEPDFLTQRGVR
jgi:hypothetical protein